MSMWNESDYLAHWPMAIPFPYAVKRNKRPVPNSNAVNWPQSQFAPLFLAPGSPSFQPYSYDKNDQPLRVGNPRYSTKNFLPYAQSNVGPDGDTSALPTEANMTAAIRMGMRNTGVQISEGVPAAKNTVPPSDLTSGLRTASATGLGDGFAFELAPLTASAPMLSGVEGDCGCGCQGKGCGSARRNQGEKDMTLWYIAGAGILLYAFMNRDKIFGR